VALVFCRFAWPLFLTAFATACSAVPNRSWPSGPNVNSETTLEFRSADGATSLHGTLTLPRGEGPFPAAVVLQSQLCEGGFPEWASDSLNSWGYATLTVDGYAARKLTPAACSDFAALQLAQTIGDAYGALRALRTDRRIDPDRVALLGMGNGSTTVLLADTVEAQRMYAGGGAPFRAFFTFEPFCRIDFANADLRPYAPERIYIGERDDMTPAEACVNLAKSLQRSGGEVAVKVYPGAEHDFDYVPPTTVTPPQDRESMHPHGENFTYPLLPYYIPFADNLKGCTFWMTSISDKVTRDDVKGCLRKGVHLASDPTSAYSAREDLKNDFARLVSVQKSLAMPSKGTAAPERSQMR
jgi:dienelactone hydrolase